MSKAAFYKIILFTVVSIGIHIDVLRMNYVKPCGIVAQCIVTNKRLQY